MYVYLYFFSYEFPNKVGNFIPQRSSGVREACSHLVGYLMYPSVVTINFCVLDLINRQQFAK